MNTIKVLVVEDEIIIADHICDTLEDLGYAVTEPAINYTEALSIIKEEKPDIAILDIQLSGRKTGIDIAKKINDDYHFPFIFLTSNADKFTVEEAKGVTPSAFLVKPFSKEELYASVEIALSNFHLISKNRNTKQETLFVKHKTGYTKIKIADILYIKGLHVYLEVFLRNREKFLIRKSMSDILASLTSNFVRIHKSYIVNFTHVNNIEGSKLKIFDLELPIGKKYKETVLKRLKIL